MLNTILFIKTSTKMKYLFYFFMVIVLFACTNNSNTTDATASNTDSVTTTTDDIPDGVDDFDDAPTGSTINSFIPDGYVFMDSASGDLNLDPYSDLILICKKENEANLDFEDKNQRPLIILTGKEDGTYIQEARNDNTVLCFNCGGVFGDPYERTVIKNGYFTVEHYGGSNWRWTRLITFKYDNLNKMWMLHRDGGDSYHTGDPNNVTTEVKTTKDFGSVSLLDFDSDMNL